MKSAEEITKAFSIVMERYRIKRGISLNELARQSGVSAALLSRINGGTRKVPGLDKVCNIVEVLVIPWTELFIALGFENRRTIDLFELISLSEFTICGVRANKKMKGLIIDILKETIQP